MGLLWSDPDRGTHGFCLNRRLKGHVYGHDVSKEFIAKHHLVRIIRAHQQVEGHDDVFRDGSVITLFSAPDYARRNGNIGEIAEINGNDIKYEKICYNIG